MIIVDASVAVKWVIEEEHSSEALRLLAKNDALFGPELLDIEVSSAVVRRANMNDFAPDVAIKAIARWRRLLDSFSVQLFRPTQIVLHHAFELAVRLRHPFKDAVYLSLAISEEAELVTADRRLLEKSRSVYPDVHHLLDRS